MRLQERRGGGRRLPRGEGKVVSQCISEFGWDKGDEKDAFGIKIERRAFGHFAFLLFPQ